jgi:hypothetical protein
MKRKPRDWRISRYYGFVRSRQLDGTINEGPEVGVYLVTGCRISAGWGMVAESRWPYPRRDEPWPPVDEPPSLDAIAKYNRTFCHFRIRDLDELRVAISRHVPPIIGIPIHQGWHKAPGGIIPMPGAATKWGERHAVLVVGYDDATQLVMFANSWGDQWGEKGFGYLPYQYIEEYMYDAWSKYLLPPEGIIRPTLQGDRFVARRAAFKNALGAITAVIDLWDTRNNIRIGWIFGSVRGGSVFEIEDLFVRPEFQAQPNNLQMLVEELQWSCEYFKGPFVYWIPDADTKYRGRNFSTANDFIRLMNLKVVPSQQKWCPYVAFNPDLIEM